MDISVQSFRKMLLKCMIQGIAVAIVTSVIPKQELDRDEIMKITLIAGSAYLILDTFAPSIANYARKGTGFMIGLNLIEGYCNCGKCSPNCQCNGGTESCGACHMQLGTIDPGRTAPGVNAPSVFAGSPPFGITSIFTPNNIFTRNINPGSSANGVPMAANSLI